ncbi:GAF and ANTAR domain-containing protein [Tomitella cavernea]|uniref:GAF and ANTAR domain-containing protein n=1 Tax=Tomitella cavernea TaxID=1387982 RepID=A0ABP9CW93_9ACTN|nr:GAF and ANTAR domain-containing protein [Tomitella cavernea]
MDISSSQHRESRLVDAFVDMADTLVADFDTVELLHRLTEYCVELLGAAEAGLLLADQRGSLQLVASSAERTELVELFQLQVNEGPCMDCFRTGQTVSVADLAATADRWPTFTPEALSVGYVSVHTVPLRLRDQTIGALNLFGTTPGVLSEADRHVARALAETATIGILSERAIRHGEVLTEQLQTALNNRVIIEQAKGVLAHAGDLPIDETFAVLRDYGRARQTRLTDIARSIVTGALDTAEVLAAEERAR